MPAAMLVAGALFGRASLFGALAPFGPALAAAVDWTWGWRPGLAALIGAVAGSASQRGALGALEALLLSGAAVLYTRARGTPPAGSGWWGTGVAALAIVAGAPFATAETPSGAWAATIAQALLVPLLAVILAPALAAVREWTEGGGRGQAPAAEPHLSADSLAAAVGLCVATGVAVAGLGGVHAGPVELRGVLATLLALAAANLAGAGGGAAAGVALGLATFLFGSGGPGVVAGWGFGGLLAGAFAPWGRLPATVGFLMGAGLAFLPTPLGELPDPGAGAGMFCGMLIYLLTPSWIWPRGAVQGQAWPRPLPWSAVQPAAAYAEAVARSMAEVAAARGSPRRGPGVRAAGAGRRAPRPGALAGRGAEGAPPRPFGRPAHGGEAPPPAAARPERPLLHVLRGGAREPRGTAGATGARAGALGARAGAGPGEAPDDGQWSRFAKAFRKLAEAFEPAPWERPAAPPDGGAASGEDALAADPRVRDMLAESLRAEVCRGCPAHAACWQRNGARTADLLGELVQRGLREGRLSRRRLTGFWATGCHRPGEMVVAVNYGVRTMRQEWRWHQDALDGRGLVADQLRGVAEIVERFAVREGDTGRAAAARPPLAFGAAAAEGGRPARASAAGFLSSPEGSPTWPGGAEGPFDPPAAGGRGRVVGGRGPGSGPLLPGGGQRGEAASGLLHYQVGVAKRARPGRLVSGDTHLVKEIGRHLLVALSDGMGVGGAAARQSQAAVSLLESLLDAGVACREAVRAVNTALVLRNRDESFATLDVLYWDRATGEATFLKIGGAPGYVVRDGRVTPVQGGGVPLGILRDMNVAARPCTLLPGDLVVLVSDGVWEAGPEGAESDWVRGYLLAGATGDPAALADGLVAFASARRGEGGRPHDDMTALVVRIVAEPVAGSGGTSPRAGK